MIVELKVKFRVEGPEGEEIDDNQAWSAADLAMWNNLALVGAHGGQADSVEVHVDGLGKCRVSLVDPAEATS